MGHVPATIPTELYSDPATPLAPIEPEFAQSVQQLPCNNEIIQRGGANTEEEDLPNERHEDHPRSRGLEYRKYASCLATVYLGLNPCGETSYIALQRWASPVEVKIKSPAATPLGVKLAKNRITIVTTQTSRIQPAIIFRAFMSSG